MEILNRVLAIQNYQSFSDVFSEGTKQASESSDPKKRVNWTQQLRFGNGVMMIMPIEETKWVHSVVDYVRLSALFIYRDNGDFETEKARERMFAMSRTDLKFNLLIWQKGLLGQKNAWKEGKHWWSDVVQFQMVSDAVRVSQFDLFQLFVESFW